jgi:hypothetical protein
MQIKLFLDKKMDEASKNNRMRSGEQPGVTHKSDEAPSPGSTGIRILSRYSMTVNNLMNVVGVE